MFFSLLTCLYSDDHGKTKIVPDLGVLKLTTQKIGKKPSEVTNSLILEHKGKQTILSNKIECNTSSIESTFYHEKTLCVLIEDETYSHYYEFEHKKNSWVKTGHYVLFSSLPLKISSLDEKPKRKLIGKGLLIELRSNQKNKQEKTTIFLCANDNILVFEKSSEHGKIYGGDTKNSNLKELIHKIPLPEKQDK